ncbi:MAG: HNH endonuclease, partial [Gordonia sp. (in: high G+C Gram-positive bacteria)]
MDATTLTSFTDLLIDDLTLPATGDARSIGETLDQPRLVLDETEVLALMVGAVRLRTVADYLISRTVVAAERLAIPHRKHLKKGADLLTALGVAPAVAYRAARVGHAAGALPTVTRDLRDGHLSIEHADAIGKGLAHITDRVDLDDTQQATIIRTLKSHTTPADITTCARALAIELAPTPEQAGDDYLPAAENHVLNDMTLHQNDEGRIVGEFDLDVL